MSSIYRVYTEHDFPELNDHADDFGWWAVDLATGEIVAEGHGPVSLARWREYVQLDRVYSDAMSRARIVESYPPHGGCGRKRV